MKITPALFVISGLMVFVGCIVAFIRGCDQGWGNVIIAIPIVGILWMLLNSLLIGILHFAGLRRSARRYNPVNVAATSVIVSLVSGLSVYYL